MSSSLSAPSCICIHQATKLYCAAWRLTTSNTLLPILHCGGSCAFVCVAVCVCSDGVPCSLSEGPRGEEPAFLGLPFSLGNLVAKVVANCKRTSARAAKLTFMLTSPVWLRVVSEWRFIPPDDTLKGKRDLCSFASWGCWFQMSSCGILSYVYKWNPGSSSGPILLGLMLTVHMAKPIHPHLHSCLIISSQSVQAGWWCALASHMSNP